MWHPQDNSRVRQAKKPKKIIPEKLWIKLRDDDTLNAILERYKKGKTANLKKKALFLDDGTTLFTTKNRRFKDRLISGFAVLLSEGSWTYGERQNPDLTLKGKVSLIMNLTLESYCKHESRLLGSTFLERFLTIFCDLPQVEIETYLNEQEERKNIVWNHGKLTNLRLKPFEIGNLSEHKKLLIDYAERFSVLSLKSINGCYDQIIALLKSHLALNNRIRIVKDDLDLLKAIEPYLVNPFAPNQHKIIRLYKEGRSQKDICLVLGRDPQKYQAYVSRVLRKAKERGVLDIHGVFNDNGESKTKTKQKVISHG